MRKRIRNIQYVETMIKTRMDNKNWEKENGMQLNNLIEKRD